MFAKDARSTPRCSLACAGVHGRLPASRRSLCGRPSSLLQQPWRDSSTAIDAPCRRPTHLWAGTQPCHRYYIRVPHTLVSYFRDGIFVHTACLACCQAVFPPFHSLGYRQCHECSEELARYLQHLRVDQVATHTACCTSLLVSYGSVIYSRLHFCLTCSQAHTDHNRHCPCYIDRVSGLDSTRDA